MSFRPHNPLSETTLRPTVLKILVPFYSPEDPGPEP